jgi:hypothetical protein
VETEVEGDKKEKITQKSSQSSYRRKHIVDLERSVSMSSDTINNLIPSVSRKGTFCLRLARPRTVRSK